MDSTLARREAPPRPCRVQDRRWPCLASGAPVRRDEYWKFSNPAGLTALPAQPAALLVADEAPVFGAADALRLVFVDGVLAPERSDQGAIEGVEIRPLAEALATDIHWARELFGVLEARGQVPVDRPLAALNTARAVQGLAIRVTGRAARPVSVAYLRSSESSDALVRHLVKLEPGAAFTLKTQPYPGWDGTVNCRVLEIDAPRKLSYAWTVPFLDTVVTFTLAPTSAGTHLTLVQTGFNENQKREFGGARYGWKMMGGRLVDLLARIP